MNIAHVKILICVISTASVYQPTERLPRRIFLLLKKDKINISREYGYTRDVKRKQDLGNPNMEIITSSDRTLSPATVLNE